HARFEIGNLRFNPNSEEAHLQGEFLAFAEAGLDQEQFAKDNLKGLFSFLKTHNPALCKEILVNNEKTAAYLKEICTEGEWSTLTAGPRKLDRTSRPTDTELELRKQAVSKYAEDAKKQELSLNSLKNIWAEIDSLVLTEAEDKLREKFLDSCKIND